MIDKVVDKLVDLVTEVRAMVVDTVNEQVEMVCVGVIDVVIAITRWSSIR